MRMIRGASAVLVGVVSVIAASAAMYARAENLTFSGTGTVRILASDWADYTGGSSTVNVGANAGGRLYWRSEANAGDGQYIHFDLTRLQGLTMLSSANVTLQNTDAQYGGGVDGSFIATANGAWTAANGAALPGATAIGDATNATGSYGSGTSITWGIGSSTFQGYVDNAASFNGLAVIGGAGSQMHFSAPLSPYLTVATSATMSDVVTVSGGAAWNSGNYSFTDGVLAINNSVADGQSGAGDVTINSLGTVFVNGNSNKYWAIDSTRINAGGVLMSYGHSHLHNLTLAGGELAGIRPDGPNGGWTFDDATTVTGGGTSTISAQQINLDNGTFTIDAGSTLNFTGSVRSGVITPTIGAGGRLVYGAAAGSATTLGAVTLNGGELAATSQPSTTVGNYVLGGNVTVGGSSMSTISADVRVIGDANRTFDVADVDSGSGVDLLLSGRLGHQSGVSWGYATKAGTGTMKMSGANEIGGMTVNAGRLVLEGGGIGGMWASGLTNNAAVEFSVADSRTADFGISGSGSITKTGTGQLTIAGNNQSSGGLVVNGGTVIATKSPEDNNNESSLGSGSITINSGGTLRSAANWTTSSPWKGATVGSITVNNGGTWDIQNIGQLIRNGLFLNGGTVSGPAENADWGGLLLWSNVTAGGNAVSTVSVDTALDTVRAITVDAGSQLVFSGKIHNQIGATGAITKAGTGTLVLSGNNSYSGLTIFEGGVVNAATFANNGSASSLGVGTGDPGGDSIGLLFRGGTLQYTGSTAQSTDRAIRLSTVGGGGTIDASGSSPEATLSFTASSSPNLFENPGTRTLTLAGTNIGANTFAMRLEDQSTNATSLVKSGAGTWVLTAANTYTGNTTVSAGTLISQNTYASSGFAVASGAVLEIDVASGSRDSATTTFSGSGTLRKTGAGELIWGPGVATFSFAPGALIDVQAGTFVAGSYGNETWSSNQSDLNVASGAVFNTVEANVRVNTITGSGTIQTGYSGAGYQNFTFGVNDGSSTFSGVIADSVNRGSIAKTGTGTVTLSGSNTYSGQTDITAGTLVATNNAALGSGGLDGNTMTWIRSGATLGLQGDISTDEHLHMVGIGIGGQGALRSIGGSNTMTQWIALDGNTTVGVDAGTLTLTNRLYGDGEFNASTLTKVGAGTLVLQGDNVLTGGLVVDGGTVVANRSQQDFGVASLGDGPVTVNNGGTLRSTANWTTATPFGNPRAVGAITINDGGTWSIEAVGQMVRNGLYLNGGTIVGTGSSADWGGLLISSNITASGSAVSSVNVVDTALDGGRTITVDGGSQVNFTGVIHNQIGTAGAITKAGGGVLVLSGSNGYSGGTTLGAGTLRLESTSALGSGGLSMAGGTTLQLRGDSSATFAGGDGLGGLGGASITFDVDRLTGGASGQTLSFAPAGFNTANTTINVTGGNGYTLALGGVNEGLGGPLTLNAVSANLQIGAIGSSSAVSSLSVGGAANTTITGAVATTGGLTKTGAGLLTLSGVSNYTGDTTISSGTLALGGSGQLGNGSYAGPIANAGTLVVATSANQTLSGIVSGVGSLSKSGAGALTLTAANTFAGGVSLAAGTIRVGDDAALSTGTVTITGGGLSSDGATARTLSNPLVVVGGATLGDAVNTGLLTLTGGVDLGGTTRGITTPSDVAIASAVTNGGLTKAGAGTLTLSASNSFTGGSTISAGVVEFVDGALGPSGTVTVGQATLRWAAGTTQDISSRLALVNDTTATLDIGVNDVTLGSGFGAGSSAGVTKAGAGTLTLTGSSGYTGLTTVSTGTLALSGSGALAAAVDLPVSGAVLDISGASGNRTIGGLSGGGGSQVLLGNNTLTVAGSGPSPTYAGVISGAGGFTLGGGLFAFTTQQAFTGPARVEAGTLEIGADDTLESVLAIVVGLSPGSAASIDALGAGLRVFETQTLGGYGTVTGLVTFLGGSTLSPGGSVGTLTNDGSTTWVAGMRYLFEVNDATGDAGGPAGWDLFRTTGGLTLSGTDTNKFVIELASLSGDSGGPAANFSPGVTHAWKFVEAGSEIGFDASWFVVDPTNFLNATNGSFSVARGDALPTGFAGSNNELYVVYAAVPEPGTLLLAGAGLACVAASVARRRRAGGA